MKKLNYFIFFSLLMFIICGKVNALGLEGYSISFNGNTLSNTTDYVSVGGNVNPNLSINYQVSDTTPLSNKSITAIFDICSTGGFSTTPDDISNWSFKVLKTGINCQVSGYSGSIKRLTITGPVGGQVGGSEGLPYKAFATINGIPNLFNQSWNTFYRIDSVNVYYTGSNELQMQEEMNNINSNLDEQIQQDKEQHEETMNTITSSDVDSPNNLFSEFESYLPENGVITELITLPVSLFQKVLSSINGSCSQYNLGNLMGTDLILPCINISNYLGSSLWNVIDILFSGLFVLVISKKMIKAFNNFSSMEEGDVLD